MFGFVIDDGGRNWEYQEENLQEPVSVAGNLLQKREFWRKTLNASNFVTTIIEKGYSLPFIKQCPPYFAKNNASSLRNTEFVEDAIEKLVQGGYVKEIFMFLTVAIPLP